mmetsp:Transcript_51092/g.94532  ORF Transcript_51092/g.94532 Transcript_51092/m.94532 type:complete len:80 (+) Transcript_51092:114-353(+)
MTSNGCNAICACICAYFIPPLGIWWRFGCGLEFCICFVLTWLGYFPGLLYAIIMLGCEEPSRYQQQRDVHISVQQGVRH